MSSLTPGASGGRDQNRAKAQHSRKKYERWVLPCERKKNCERKNASKENSFSAQPKIFIRLSRSLFEPLMKSRRILADEEIDLVINRKPLPGEMPDHFLVVKKDISIVFPGA